MKMVRDGSPARVAPAPDTPSGASRDPVIIIEPSRGRGSLRLRDLWEYRELLYFFVWRDIRVRYKQAVMGTAWAVVQPVMTMVVFTVVFGHFARFPSEGVPYPVFSYAALLPWNFFSNGLSRVTMSVAGSGSVISKVYFPRLVVPLAAGVSGIVDLAIAFVLLLGIMAWFGFTPTLAMLTLPLFVLFDLATVLAFGLWLSALNVKYRDVSHAIPLVIQLWMFASPVAYPVSMVPAQWRALYQLNPVVGVVQGFRWAVLGKQPPDMAFLAINAVTLLVMLWAGVVYFRRMEQTFADVI